MGSLARSCAVAAVLLVVTGGSGHAVGPSFDCNTEQTPVAQLICASPDLSRADLEFVQSYYALRQQVGPAGWQALKREDIDFQHRTDVRCGIAPSGALPPDTVALAACLRLGYTAQRAIWLSRLSGAALEEARRPVERHVALQRDLQASGFLPPTATIDGVYGAATRSAILAWQRSKGMPQTGFIDNEVATELIDDAEPGSRPPGRDKGTANIVVLEPPGSFLTSQQLTWADASERRQYCEKAAIPGTGIILTRDGAMGTVSIRPEFIENTKHNQDATSECKLHLEVKNASGQTIFVNAFAIGEEEGGYYDVSLMLHSFSDGGTKLIVNEGTGGRHLMGELRVFSFTAHAASQILLVGQPQEADIVVHGDEIRVTGGFNDGHSGLCCLPVRSVVLVFDPTTSTFRPRGDTKAMEYYAQMQENTPRSTATSAYLGATTGAESWPTPWYLYNAAESTCVLAATAAKAIGDPAAASPGTFISAHRLDPWYKSMHIDRNSDGSVAVVEIKTVSYGNEPTINYFSSYALCQGYVKYLQDNGAAAKPGELQ